MKKIIYLNSGHFSGDPGAIVEGFRESEENQKIRDALVPKLKAEGFEVVVIPDTLDLRKSIDLVNQNARDLEDGLGIDIHLNRDSGIASGTEVYFYAGSQASKDKAEVLSRNISQILRIPDRGARPDTSSSVGSLGWVRQVNCWSFVVEVLYLDHPLGAVSKFIKEKQYDLIAEGILNGVRELYGIYTAVVYTADTDVKLNYLQTLINQIREQIRQLLLKIKK